MILRVLCVAVAVCGLAGCAGDLLEPALEPPLDEAPLDETPLDQEPLDEMPSSESAEAVAGHDPSLQRDDDLCLPDDPDGIDYTVAHYVVDGVLGGTCFGEESAALLEAWNVLAELTPPGQLRDLAVFAGFDGGSAETDGVTVAFVAPTADESVFEMSVNLTSWGADPVEDAFSMAHEFSHVFTSVPVELDMSVDPDDCENYDGGGAGCYAPDSIMAQWYEQFWADTGYSPTAEDANDPDVGEDRCRETPGFFGDYAASNPEEDFAEAFAAYVMAWDAATPEQQDRLDWIDQYVGLREFRDRAARFGYSPQENTLAVCGI